MIRKYTVIQVACLLIIISLMFYSFSLRNFNGIPSKDKDEQPRDSSDNYIRDKNWGFFKQIPSLTILIPFLQESNDELQNHPAVIKNGKIVERDVNKEINKLEGKTLDIYHYLMEQKGTHGVRSIQRTFDYSSPNLAYYHLNKLYQLDIVDKNDENKYYINDQNLQKFGEYQNKVKVFGNWISMNLIISGFLFLLSILGIISIILKIQLLVLLIIITSMLSLSYYFLRKSLKFN